MFEFIKKLFVKEIEKVNLNLSDINKWFEEKTKNYDSELTAYIKDKIVEIDSIKQEILTANNNLAVAAPQDEDKVMPRIKHTVEGYKQNYIRKVNQLLTEINIDGLTIDSTVQTCKKVIDSMNIFAKETEKSYFATQHLFHKQVEPLAQNIRNLDKTIIDLNSHVNNSNAIKTIEIKELNSKLNKDIDLLKEWEFSIIDLEKQKNNLIQQEKDTQQEITDLKNNDIYKNYENYIINLKKAKDELKKKSDKIFELIAPLDTALKKYERITLEDQDIIKKYIDKPVMSLLEDLNLKLLDILQKIKTSLENGSLDLKDKKREKTKIIIDSLTKDELRDMQKSYNDLENNITKINNEINKSTVKDKEQELIKKREKINDEKNNTEREINETKEKIKKVDIEKDKKQMIEKIKNLLDIEVILN